MPSYNPAPREKESRTECQERMEECAIGESERALVLSQLDIAQRTHERLYNAHICFPPIAMQLAVG